MTLRNSFMYLYLYIIYEYFKFNPNLANQLTLIYRLAISIALSYVLITNNPIIVINYIDTFEATYFNLLEGDNTSICDTSLHDVGQVELVTCSLDNPETYEVYYYTNYDNDNDNDNDISYHDIGLIQINPWNNPLGEGSSRQGNLGSGSGGPSGQGPEGGGNSLALGGNESTRKDKDDLSSENNEPKVKEDMPEFRLSRNRRVYHNGPKFCWFEKLIDRNKYRRINPERFHQVTPQLMFGDTLRVYEDSGLIYTYTCQAYKKEFYHCRVTYPDGTKLTIVDKPTVLKHIEFHKKQVYYGYSMEPVYPYIEKYKNYFDVFRKEKIQRIFYPDLYPSPEDRRDMLKIPNILNSDSDTDTNINRPKTSNIYNLLNSNTEIENKPKTSNIYDLLNSNKEIESIPKVSNKEIESRPKVSNISKILN